MNEQAQVGGGQLQALRVWPPMVLLILMAISRFLPGWIEDGPAMIWMVAAFGPVLLGLCILLWWLTFSRASGLEKIGGILCVMVACIGASVILHPTMIGPAVMVLMIPMGIAAFAVTLVALSQWRSRTRTLVAVLASVLGFGFASLLKSDGMWGDFSLGLDWRWNETPEERFLANTRPTSSLTRTEELNAWLAKPEWPGFRGAARDGVQHGTTLNGDWQGNPPELIWRIDVGPAWSSFAVAGRLLFTQEQRGESEAVVCYDAENGTEIWVHTIESRFFDALGGLGPRATPTIADGSVFAMGAEGWLVRLDGASGQVQWQVDLREAADREPPMWGFSSSPLVTEGVVVVHAGGAGEKGILAFDATTGQLKWSTAAGVNSYGSLQSVHLLGQPLLALLSDTGASLLRLADGTPALNYEWNYQGYRALQPQVIGQDSILIPTGAGGGTRLVKFSEQDGQWRGSEIWTSRDMKPDFNDLVVYKDYLYGFDGAIFACVDLRDGSRKWKKGRYGKGQVLLLADSGLLLVATEQGELVLLEADPAELLERARLQVLDGKTWNHPVVVGDRLYMRNASQAVCFRLPILASEDLHQAHE